MKAVAEALHVSRSNLSERLKGKSKPRGPYLKADDAELLPAIRKLVDARPTYGYRRIAGGYHQNPETLLHTHLAYFRRRQRAPEHRAME